MPIFLLLCASITFYLPLWILKLSFSATCPTLPVHCIILPLSSSLTFFSQEFIQISSGWFVYGDRRRWWLPECCVMFKMCVCMWKYISGMMSLPLKHYYIFSSLFQTSQTDLHIECLKRSLTQTYREGVSYWDTAGTCPISTQPLNL